MRRARQKSGCVSCGRVTRWAGRRGSAFVGASAGASLADGAAEATSRSSIDTLLGDCGALVAALGDGPLTAGDAVTGGAGA